MKRALVLSSGLASVAYPIGALRHLIGERHFTFDLCAGTGWGAITAAFVACGEFEALDNFWQHIGWRKLLAFNGRGAWRNGLFNTTPLEYFLAAHLSENKLVSPLRFTCLNLQTGREEVSVYPGSPLPLLDTLAAAVVIPGLMAPLRVRHQQWVDASFVNSFTLRAIVREYAVEEVWAIATSPTEAVVTHSPRQRYPHWRAVADRGLRLNQAHDVWAGLRAADQLSKAAGAHRYVQSQLPDRLAGLIIDPVAREQMRDRVQRIFDQSTFALKRDCGSSIHAITPSRLLDGSLWRFRRPDINAALQLGYQDAMAST